MSNSNIETEKISDNGSYAKYFFHRDGNLWHCIVHLHLGEYNDITYNTFNRKKKIARFFAKKHVNLRCKYLQSHKEKNLKSKMVDLIFSEMKDYVPKFPVDLFLKKKNNPNINKLSMDKALPTSREDDIEDNYLYEDSTHNSKVTIEELDEEMDDYWTKKNN